MNNTKRTEKAHQKEQIRNIINKKSLTRGDYTHTHTLKPIIAKNILHIKNIYYR